jgi:stearoyl-CoA desaturase (delta-9 desaturase)
MFLRLTLGSENPPSDSGYFGKDAIKMETITAPVSSRWARLTIPTIARHVWNLTPMILAHVGALAVLIVGGSWQEWLLLPMLVYVRGLLVTAGYHRYFSHRSYKTSRPGQFLLAFLGCANLQQGPLWWAAYHRHHHMHSDEPDDVHSPYHGGFWWAYCGWLFVPLTGSRHLVRDLCRFPELVWLERFWQIPGLLLAGLCWWLGGWSMLCLDFCLSAVVIFHMTFLVNTLGHLIGSRRYPTRDHSTNSFLLALLTMGDGWHNNHHHYPHSAQAGFFWWEVDGSFRVIRLLENLGLVWGVRRVPAHKLEPRSPKEVQLLSHRVRVAYTESENTSSGETPCSTDRMRAVTRKPDPLAEAVPALSRRLVS